MYNTHERFISLTFRSDPILLSILDDLLTDLTRSPNAGVYQTVVSQALPTLCNALAQAKADESWIASSAIDLISSLARGASHGSLGEGFFAALAPTLFECMRCTQDQETLEVHVLPHCLDLARSLIVPVEWDCPIYAYCAQGSQTTDLLDG